MKRNYAAGKSPKAAAQSPQMKAGQKTAGVKGLVKASPKLEMAARVHLAQVQTPVRGPKPKAGTKTPAHPKSSPPVGKKTPAPAKGTPKAGKKTPGPPKASPQVGRATPVQSKATPGAGKKTPAQPKGTPLPVTPLPAMPTGVKAMKKTPKNKPSPQPATPAGVKAMKKTPGQPKATPKKAATPKPSAPTPQGIKAGKQTPKAQKKASPAPATPQGIKAGKQTPKAQKKASPAPATPQGIKAGKQTPKAQKKASPAPATPQGIKAGKQTPKAQKKASPGPAALQGIKAGKQTPKAQKKASPGPAAPQGIKTGKQTPKSLKKASPAPVTPQGGKTGKKAPKTPIVEAVMPSKKNKKSMGDAEMVSPAKKIKKGSSAPQDAEAVLSSLKATEVNTAIPSKNEKAKATVDQADAVPSSDTPTTVEAPTKSAQKGKRDTALTRSQPTRSVVYIRSLPHGFFERELYRFMNQFGSVTRIKIVRSSKTGRSCGYAFVEFKYAEVAKIVAETMNNYLMFDRLIKCEVLDPSKVNPAMFHNKVNPERPPGNIRRRKDKKAMNQLRTEEQNNRRLKKQLAKLSQVHKKLSAMGVPAEIDFDTAKEKLKGLSKTPLMKIDTDECDIKMKTPPNVKKVKSRGNSAAATPNSNKGTPKGALAKLPREKKNLMMAKLGKMLSDFE